jgi:hypothetical protein
LRNCCAHQPLAPKHEIPDNSETFKLLRDRHFVEKLRDVVARYLNPPERALVLSVDEKSEIQALDRTQPELPMKRRRCGTRTHDYKRHGTTTVYAALRVLDGAIIGQCVPRHRSQEFIRFLTTVDEQTSTALVLHLIVDNSSTDRTPRSKLTSSVILAFIFTHADQQFLAKSGRTLVSQAPSNAAVSPASPSSWPPIYDYLNHYNQSPKPFLWPKRADMILAKIDRCNAAPVTHH